MNSKKLCLASGLCAFVVLALSAADNQPPVRDSADLKASRDRAIAHPSDPSVQKEHAELCLKEHHEAEAVMAAQSARAAATTDPEANRLYVIALARNGQYQEAVDAQASNASWVVGRDVKGAVEAAQSALSADEKIRNAPETGAQATFKEAAALLEKAVAADNDNLAVRVTLGWIYLDKLYQPQLAYPHLAVAARYHPDDINARKLFGSACAQTGRNRKAIEEFREASLLHPHDPWIEANLGRSLARAGKYDEAEHIFVDVLDRDPKNIDAQLGQAEVAAWRGHSGEAIELLDRILQEDPNNLEAINLRADVHRWNWRLTEANADYKRALDVSENNAQAKDGLKQSELMRAPELKVTAYQFKDNANFQREYIEGSTRLPLTDKAYFIAHGTGWRFSNPGTNDLDRIDGLGGLEVDWARWLSTTIEAGVYDYENRDPIIGGQASVKISPTPRSDIYTVVGLRQPFISSISTVYEGIRQDSVGNGIDLKFGRHISFQNNLQLAQLSDDNAWVEEKPQLSYRILGKPEIFLRAQYDFLSYRHNNPAYWTPIHRHSVAPILDVSIPLGNFLHLDADGQLPYIFNEQRFGYQVQGGPTLDISQHFQLGGSYLYSSIPGDQGAWSGHGWQAYMRIRF